jgi:hypothetical protein
MVIACAGISTNPFSVIAAATIQATRAFFMSISQKQTQTFFRRTSRVQRDSCQSRNPLQPIPSNLRTNSEQARF